MSQSIYLNSYGVRPNSYGCSPDIKFKTGVKETTNDSVVTFTLTCVSQN